LSETVLPPRLCPDFGVFTLQESDTGRTCHRPHRTQLTAGWGSWVGAVGWVGRCRLLSAGADRELRLWDTSSHVSQLAWRAGEEAADGEEEGVGGLGSQLSPPAAASPLAATRAHSRPVVALAAKGAGAGGLPAPPLALTGSSDGTVALWEMTADGLRRTRTLLRSDAAVADVVWHDGGGGGGGAVSSASGCCVGGSTAAGIVRLWDLRLRSAAVWSLEAGRGLADALALSGDALFAAGGGGDRADRSVAVWDLRQRRLVARLTGHLGAVTALASVGPEGVASADAAGSVRSWSIARAYERAVPAEFEEE